MSDTFKHNENIKVYIQYSYLAILNRFCDLLKKGFFCSFHMQWKYPGKFSALLNKGLHTERV